MLPRFRTTAAARLSEGGYRDKEDKDWLDTQNPYAASAEEKILNYFSKASGVIQTNAPLSGEIIRRGSMVRRDKNFPSTASSCAKSKKSNACTVYWKTN